VGCVGRLAHEAVSRRPPISLDTIVARTHMYTYDAKVWDVFGICPSFQHHSLSPRALIVTHRFSLPAGAPVVGGGQGSFRIVVESPQTRVRT
jgi:hypothetical protein